METTEIPLMAAPTAVPSIPVSPRITAINERETIPA